MLFDHEKIVQILSKRQLNETVPVWPRHVGRPEKAGMFPTSKRDDNFPGSFPRLHMHMAAQPCVAA